MTELRELKENAFAEMYDGEDPDEEEEHWLRMFTEAERIVGEMDGKLEVLEDEAGIRLG